MTAAALETMAGAAADIHLIESEDIGIVGVGEATLPHLRAFIARLGIDESEFMAATQATYKLGIEFSGFGREGDRYIHPFGTYGRSLAGVGFHHFWLRARAEDMASRIDDYSFAVMAAEAGRFAKPADDANPIESFGYAYQFDATLFGPYLRDRATARGVQRTEGRVVSVERHESGDVAALHLESGARIEGDLFIDCSGFRALLIGDEEWEDWSHWLPCDRAVAAPCADASPRIEPYTRAIAMPAGWRWRIPLRHRVGNGYVYSSKHCSDDQARQALLDSLESDALAEPRVLRFSAGRRKRSWVGNVVSIGLASGFLEPLESTSIYLIQAAITGLLEHFPDGAIEPAERDAFNREIDYEYDRIRDFLILHYNATERSDSDFWNHVRTMDIPASLAEKMELWRSCALVPQYRRGLFLEPSWISVMIGQGILPDGWDPRAQFPSSAGLHDALSGLSHRIAESVDGLPTHDAALAEVSAP
tara:strand:- start:3185 stop:4615 length:1431 start_codon:yes stop_codon:yes gene_type:complete